MKLHRMEETDRDGKGRVIRRRHRYVQASHGFVQTTQGGDRGYGDAAPRGSSAGEIVRTKPTPDMQEDIDRLGTI